MTISEGSLADCSARLPPEVDGVGEDREGVVWAVVPVGSTFWGILDTSAGSAYFKGGEPLADA